MTVLDLLLSNLPGTTTLASELYCTSTSLDNSELRATTVCSIVMTYLDSIQVPTNIAEIRETYSYIESMSEEDLIKANEHILNKELDFEISKKEERPKVYQKEIKKRNEEIF